MPTDEVFAVHPAEAAIAKHSNPKSMTGALRLLLVDDDAEKQFLLALQLRRHFPDASITSAESGAAAIEHLKAQDVDAIITDHSMAPVNGIELIIWVRQRSKDLPILMVTGHPEIEGDAFRAGANEVVSTFRFAEVGTIVARLLGNRR